MSGKRITTLSDIAAALEPIMRDAEIAYVERLGSESIGRMFAKIRPGLDRISISVPLRTRSMANARLHWAAKAKIVKAEREAVAMHCRGLGPEQVPCTVTLTRIAPRQLDDDNLRSALKAVRDEVARLLKVDDRDKRVVWEYGQEKGEPKEYAVIVEVKA